ncbi:sugar phosphate isomerase/epimerase [Aneurinibacillus sp. Ricciae_BoGa-3]|uniref:sugar phosphate isomerase/epimerase family protein n=1 Tax=Aneurinibacillus sp. Ricciae_BoGa-3 TaxID=3022697 RepID=UPI0023420D69|nr:sugar phosphate isomerase/epimerase [Aneurinibacillus sp. Ricciae_BoGa-3]WCK54710.1 sugar phosphate isomerase/epimerase [Aneurinibacillus sp. Ricciae_BoGa-3]
MQIGVLTVLYQDKPFEEALDIVQEFGLEAVEFGTGNYPGNAHCNPAALLEDNRNLEAFQRAIAKRNLRISALSCHGNPLHPQKDAALAFHETWRKTVLLAEKLEVGCVNVFSGCAGDSEQSKHPNWVTCAWPPDYLEVLNWQWEQKLIPYWKSEAEFAQQHHVGKIAFEMHPGFMVYNPETLLQLRQAVGSSIGANFDPSHLLWQGIDPVEAIKLLGSHQAIFHAHAKDVYLDHTNIKRNGVLDTKPYGDIANRSWTFRSVGYGMEEATWKQIISMLRVVGYDDVLSIEHEDALASVREGFSKAVDMLKRSILREAPGEMWWA